MTIDEMKYEKECMERHIKSLQQSLEKSREKLDRLKERMENSDENN